MKGFEPVLNEREPTEQANLDASVMAQMLTLKSKHHFIAGSPLPDDRFDFSLDRKQFCPTIGEFDGFAEEHPEWGMPYGLPALSKKEEQTLKQWLANGAPATAPKPPSQAESESDYKALCSRIAIRRTDNRFWSHSDALIEDYQKTYPKEAGLFDYNRFENR